MTETETRIEILKQMAAANTRARILTEEQIAAETALNVPQAKIDELTTYLNDYRKLEAHLAGRLEAAQNAINTATS